MSERGAAISRTKLSSEHMLTERTLRNDCCLSSKDRTGVAMRATADEYMLSVWFLDSVYTMINIQNKALHI